MDEEAPHTVGLAPTLLLSMPQLNDPNFKRTVVLLCEHTADGAFGLVLNRPTGTLAADVIQLDPPVTGDRSLQLWIGGPVEQQRGWILVGEEPADAESIRVADGLYLSASPVLLRRLLDGVPPPHSRFLVGYAGWGPGQLDGELLQSAWLTADVALDLVFDTEAETMWEAAIRRLGVDPNALQMSPGVH
ncbi:MAG TPA: YqgE/AlgH family protein [Candidatus Kryptonia bacterium]|nr:YqgE/AlgH family protein [Candidatus Kryptonia bacterium]